MSGRFVRASKFRHIHAESPKKEACFSELRPETSGEGNLIAANHKYFAMGVLGGGGPLLVHPLSEPQRFTPGMPTINVHKAKVLDFDFHPFVANIVATASEDNYVKVTQFPAEGLSEEIKEATVNLDGHAKRASRVQFHPTAENVLMSAGYDNAVKVWDISSGSEMFKNEENTDNIFHAVWNRNGSLIGTASKDKYVRLFDIRSSAKAASILAFDSSKSSRVVFADNHNILAVIGFTKTSVRKVNLYDPRKLGDPIGDIEIDQAAGSIIPYYDEDTSVLFLGGKGDGNIRFYEITSDAPYIHYLSDFRSSVPQKGLCFATKPACDFMKCEVALCLRVLRDVVEPLRFDVPRKSETFQADLFPDTNAFESQLNPESWSKGANADPVLKPIQEVSAKLNSAKSGGVKLVGKKTVAELEKELAEANARIKELEDELAKYRK